MTATGACTGQSAPLSQCTPFPVRPLARLRDFSHFPSPGPRGTQPRAPRLAEQPRTKSIADASGKRKRESRQCHLKTAVPSRSAASEEQPSSNNSRSCECAHRHSEPLSPSQPPLASEGQSRPSPPPLQLRWFRRWRLLLPPQLPSLEL